MYPNETKKPAHLFGGFKAVNTPSAALQNRKDNYRHRRVRLQEGEVRSGPMRTNCLETGVSETLKVVPRRKVLQHITPGEAARAKCRM